MTTPPLGPTIRRFANMVAIIESDDDPPALLRRLKAIEHAFGRRRGRRWGARVIDLDIILWSGGAWADAWIFFGTARFAWTRLKGSGRFTPEMLGMTLAHTGIAVFVAGALLVEAPNLQTELAVKPGQTVDLGGYAFRFEGVEETRGPN